MSELHRKDPSLRLLGIFTSVLFFVGALLIIIVLLMRGWEIGRAISHPNVLIQLVSALLFYISSRSEKLYFIQPVLFLASAPVNILAAHDSFYGLGFFVMAVLLLFKTGFFERKRIPKIFALLVYLYGWELFAAIRSGREREWSFVPVLFVTVFLIYLYILYMNKIIVYLKEPKPLLDLRERGLSQTERSYILALGSGKSPKEIAVEYEVSDSTVRNTFARAYRKLGVKDKSELMSLAANNTIQ